MIHAIIMNPMNFVVDETTKGKYILLSQFVHLFLDVINSSNRGNKESKYNNNGNISHGKFESYLWEKMETSKLDIGNF